jgi:hypothetical protein
VADLQLTIDKLQLPIEIEAFLMWQRVFPLFFAVTALAPLGCGQASGDQTETAPVHYPFALTPEEVGLARRLAETDLIVDSLPSGPKTVFIKVELLPDSQADSQQRLVMVQHYRYQSDETIFTMIDLNTNDTLKREIAAHHPTALAPSEVERASQLARADGRLRPHLDIAPTRLEARPIQYADHEALFGHRVVHLLMRQDGNYLVNPRVLVDLTTETVHLETK